MSYLNAYAILSLTDLKNETGAGGTGKDRELEELINRVTGVVEDYLDRQLVTRTTSHATYLVEYHTVPAGIAHAIHLLEWPVINVHEVAEDADRDYGATTVLVENTDFVVSYPSGKLHRVVDNVQSTWSGGWRAIRVTYSAGYATASDVPWAIRDVALRLALAQWKERDHAGVSSFSDATGNTTRFYSPKLTQDMQRTLEKYRRPYIGQTGERDA